MLIAMLTATRKQAMFFGGLAAVASLVIFGIFLSAETNSPRGSGVPIQSPRVAVLTDALFDDGGWGSASSNAAKMIRENYDF